MVQTSSCKLTHPSGGFEHQYVGLYHVEESKLYKITLPEEYSGEFSRTFLLNIGGVAEI